MFNVSNYKYYTSHPQNTHNTNTLVNAHGTSFLILSVSHHHWTSSNDCWKLTCFLSVLTSCWWLFLVNCWSGPWSDFALMAPYKLTFLHYITLQFHCIADLPGSRALRSFGTSRLVVPPVRLLTIANQAFPSSQFRPTNLEQSTGWCDVWWISVFIRQWLKTHLFKKSFPAYFLDVK